MAGIVKYKKEFAEKLPDMFANGEDVSEVAIKLGVTRQSFYNWVKQHKEFEEAYNKGKLASEAWWCKLGRAGATGLAVSLIAPQEWNLMESIERYLNLDFKRRKVEAFPAKVSGPSKKKKTAKNTKSKAGDKDKPKIKQRHRDRKNDETPAARR